MNLFENKSSNDWLHIVQNQWEIFNQRLKLMNKNPKNKTSAIEAFRKYQLLERKFAKTLKHIPQKQGKY